MTQLLNLFTRRGQARSGCSLLFLIVGSILAFISATAILWTNEGRVDFGRIGAGSIPLETAAIDPGVADAFVAANGVLVGDAPVGDGSFLRPGNWLEVQRLVEMYAWEEKAKSDASSGTRTPDDYEYRTARSDEPADSSAFAAPADHANPSLTVSGGTFRPESGHIGAYVVDLRSLDLPDPAPLILEREAVVLREERTLSGEYIFIGKGRLEQPQVGDLRLRFQTVAGGKQATLFGQVDGNGIGPYFHRERNRLYRTFFSGRADALAEMSAEYRFALWGMRVVGLTLYWVSLLLVFSPLTRLLGGVPLLGGLGKGLIAVVTFVVAALLALLVAGIAWFLHNPLALLILLVLAGMIFVVVRLLWPRIQKT